MEAYCRWQHRHHHRGQWRSDDTKNHQTTLKGRFVDAQRSVKTAREVSAID